MNIHRQATNKLSVWAISHEHSQICHKTVSLSSLSWTFTDMSQSSQFELSLMNIQTFYKQAVSLSSHEHSHRHATNKQPVWALIWTFRQAPNKLSVWALLWCSICLVSEPCAMCYPAIMVQYIGPHKCTHNYKDNGWSTQVWLMQSTQHLTIFPFFWPWKMTIVL